MTTVAIDLDEIRLVRSLVHESIEHVSRSRAIHSTPSTWQVLHRATSILESLEHRISTIVSSSFFTEVPVGAGRILGVIDDWVADPKWWNRSTTWTSTPIDGILPILIGNEKLRESTFASPSFDEPDHLAALVFGSTSFTPIERLWVLATSPETTSPSLARRRIVALATVVFDEPSRRTAFSGASLNIANLEQRRRELRALLGSLVAPWQLHFTGLAQPSSDSPNDGLELLRRIAADRRAAENLANGLDVALELAFDDMPFGHEERMHHIDEIAFGVGATTEILRDVAVDVARTKAEGTNRLLTWPTKLPLGLSWPVSLGLSSTIGIVSSRLDHTDEASESAEIAEIDLRRRLAARAGELTLQSAQEHGLVATNQRDLPVDVQLEVQHAVDSIFNAANRGDSWVLVN